jgi:hypothetical protein
VPCQQINIVLLQHCSCVRECPLQKSRNVALTYNGAAKATQDASPTPTGMRQQNELRCCQWHCQALTVTKQPGNLCHSPMNGAASATKDASPTPTSMRQKMSDLKPTARPQPNVARAHVPMPMPIRRKALQSYQKAYRECYVMLFCKVAAIGGKSPCAHANVDQAKGTT